MHEPDPLVCQPFTCVVMLKHEGMYNIKDEHWEVIFSNGAIATVVFSKCSQDSLKALQLFCQMPPLYRGIAYHSAAKCKITLAKVPFEPILRLHLQKISTMQ